MASVNDIVSSWAERTGEDLWGRVLPFWMAHSIDAEYGGFFNCLDEDGAVYDTSKHIWLQGRQTWMFAKIANLYSGEEIAALVSKHRKTLAPKDTTRSKVHVEPVELTRDNLIKAAVAGADFLLKHAVRASDGQVFFCLSREGKPIAIQRKPFAATFMIIALNEVGRATGNPHYRKEALQLLDRTLGWIHTPGSLGRESFEGTPAFSPLNVPMIILNVISELAEGLPAVEAASFYAGERERCAAEIQKHIVRNKEGAIAAVLENVKPDGTPDYSCIDRRIINPGHAIEAGWFLLDYAKTAKDAAAKASALEVINWAFDAGFDSEKYGGGLIYFQDAEGYSPTALEWSMKLWWPHCEALVATAMAYRDTLEPSYMDKFVKAAEWAYKHIVDELHGEWYGYADRHGEVTHRFKGGPYKGCFHVPRALLMVTRMLGEVTHHPHQ